MDPRSLETVERLRAILAEDAKRPARERFDEMVRCGAIDAEGRVLLKGPGWEPPTRVCIPTFWVADNGVKHVMACDTYWGYVYEMSEPCGGRDSGWTFQATACANWREEER